MTYKWITFDTLNGSTVGLRPEDIISTHYSLEKTKGFIKTRINNELAVYAVSAETISALNRIMKQ